MQIPIPNPNNNANPTCCTLLHRGPLIMQILWDYQKNIYCVESLQFLKIDQKLNSRSQLHARKVKKPFKSFGTNRIKIPFVELYKECTICSILRVNTPICLAATEAKTCSAMLRRGPIIMQIPIPNPNNNANPTCWTMLRRGPIILQIPRNYQKNIYCVESLQFCR